MDPILEAYNKLVGQNLVTTKGYSFDKFKEWINNDPNSTNDLWTLYNEKGLITTPNYSFEDFNGWLRGESIKREDQGTQPLVTEFDKPVEVKTEGEVESNRVGSVYGKGMAGIGPAFSAFKNWFKGVTYRDRKKLNTEISKQAEDLSPEDIDQVVNGDKHEKQAELLANATPEDKKKATLIDFYKSTSTLELLNPAFALKKQLESGLEVNSAEETFHMNKEVDMISNAEPLYNKRFEELTNKMGGDPESFKFFSKLVTDQANGKKLNDQELEFFDQMIDQLEFHPEGSNFLQLIERRRQLELRRKDLPQKYKNAYLIDKIRKEDQYAYDKEMESRSGWYKALLSVGKMLDEAPTELGAKILGTLETDNPTVQMISSLDRDKNAWQATTKEARPTSENIADVEYNGEKFEVAFTEEGDVYNIYKNGYEYQGTTEEKQSVLEALNEQNPSHETKRKLNLSAVTRQAMDMATDQIGTIALGYVLGGASLAIAGKSTLATKILANPLIAQSIPIMLQYTGTYAQQGVRDGGITDPDDLFKYAIGGAGLETFTEMFNPIEGVTINSLLRAGKPVGKFTRKSFDALTGGSRSTLREALDVTKKAGSFLVEQGVKETIEEYMAEAGNFIQNEVYNKHFDANFENENPFTYENMRDIAMITSMVSVIPGALSLRTDKSEITKQALLSGLKFPDVVESMSKHVSETNPERKSDIDEFMSVFNRTKSLTSEFFEGDNKNVPTDFKETVSSLAFEIAKTEKKKDTDSLTKVKRGKEALEELSLKAKYGIFDQTVHNIPSNQRSEVFTNVEEKLVNTDLSNLRGSTKLKLYNNFVAEAMGLKTEPIKESINKDLRDKFNSEIKTRIKQQRNDGLSLEDIELNLISAQDLKQFDIKDKAKEFYIKQAIKETNKAEQEEKIRAFNEEIKRKKDVVDNVLSKINKEDIVEYNGLEFTYKGIDSTGNPILVTKDGARFESTPNNTITFEELNDGIGKGEITYRKPPVVETPPIVTTTTTEPVINTNDVSEDNGESVEFKEFLRKKLEDTQSSPPPPVELDEDNVDEFVASTYHNPHASVGSNSRIAVLGKPYDETITGEDVLEIDRVDSSMIATEKAVALLDKKEYEAGTKLEARINDDPNTMVYDPFYPGVREITWGELKAELPSKTLTGLPLSIEDMIPIDLYKDGKIIPGNVHTVAWVNKNADNNTKEEELQNIRRIRKAVFEGNKEIVITSHDYGPLNIGERHSLDENTPLVVFKDGAPIIGKSKFIGKVNGVTYVETDQTLVPVSRPFLIEEEINTVVRFLRLALGIDKNQGIVNQLKNIGKDINEKGDVESFISNFFMIDIPKSNENFNSLMAAKATQFYGKKQYVGINIDKDGDSFSLLVGITDQNVQGKYKVFKIKKTDSGHVIETMVAGKYVSTPMLVDRFFSDLSKYLANKRLNHKNLETLHFINDEVRPVDYNKYLRSRLETNIHFTPTKEGITPFFQPVVEIDTIDKPIVLSKGKEAVSSDTFEDYSPELDDSIGKYLEDYIIKGEPSQLVDDVSSSMLGLVYRDIINQLKTKTLSTGSLRAEAVNLLSHYSNLHKMRLENFKGTLPEGPIKERIQKILDNWQIIDNKAQVTYDTKLSEFVEEIDEDNESLSDLHGDDKTFTANQLAESKPYIKALFLFISKDAEKHNTILKLGDDTVGLYKKYYTQEEVWNGITEVISLRTGNYITPRWSEYKKRILESNLEFKRQFVDVVDGTFSNSQRNELVGRLYNSSRNMVLYRDNGMKDGYRDYWQLRISSNTAQKKDQWISNFINSKYITKTTVSDSDGNTVAEHKLNTNEFKEVIKELRSLYKDKDKFRKESEPHVKKLKEVFSKLGIVLSDTTYENFINDRWKGDLFGQGRGNMLYSIIDSLDNRTAVDKHGVVNVTKLFKDQMFDRLIAFDLESGGDKSSRQVYSGDKVIQTLGPVRNYEKKLAQLIQGLSKVRETAFGKLSLWHPRNVVNNEVDPHNAMSYESTPIEAIRQESKGTGNVGYDSFTERDHIVYRLAIFEQASNIKTLQRRKYVTPPMEDKKNPFVITAPYYELKKDGSVSRTQNGGDYIDVLIEQLFIPELLRMNNKITNAPAEYNPNNYYLVPELNNIPELRNTNFFIQKQMEQDINSTGFYDVKNWFVAMKGENGEITRPHYDLVKRVIQEHFDQIVADEKKLWEKNGIYNYLPKHIKEKEDIEKDLGLKDYILNYVLFNVNEQMNISGDPALFGKYNSSFEFSYNKVINTLVNKQKRLAGENAAIIPIAEPGIMRILTINDPKIPLTNKSFLSKYLNDEDLDKYEGQKKGSDASMLSTAQNYLRVLHGLGKITDSQLKELGDTFKNQSKDIKKQGFISKENLLNDNDIDFILQPLKTMIHSKEIKDGIERISYIKMAEFPLIPQVTQGFDIDKIRQLAEDNNVDKVTFPSGFKLGSPLAMEIDMTKDDLGLSSVIPDDHIVVVSEEGYGEQTENPQKESTKVVHGSQQVKLKFLNILDKVFNYKGEPKKGSELRVERDKLYDRLFEIKYNKLVSEITTKDGEINFDKLEKIVRDELREFDPTYAYALQKEIIQEKIPLWLNPLFKRIQPKLLAIVEHRISSTKVRGKSYVQAFSDLFRTKDISKTNIKVTRNFDGELKSITERDGEIVGAQIMIPWMFKRSIKNYLDKDGYIDFNKIPQKVLEGTGFRIPTSGHNSVTRFEIVGFLPKWMGNTILLPSDVLVQMGSDLDFDKLYSLFYNTVEVSEGNNHAIVDIRDYNSATGSLSDQLSGDVSKLFNIVTKEKDSEEKEIENELLDIDKSIYLTDDKSIRKQNHTPINFGKLRELADKVADNELKNKFISPLSPSYHIQKYRAGRVGKTGIGSFSIDNVFNATLQGTNIEYIEYDESLFDIIKGPVLELPSGKKYKSVSLTSETVIGGDRFISDVYSAYQQAMLDNGKEQMSDKLNITVDTMHFIRGMIQTGHEEPEIHELLAKPVIQRLLNEVQLYSGYFTPAFKNQKDLLNEMLKKDPKNKDLLKYKAYFNIGISLSGIRSIMNIDSKGLMGSGWFPILKKEDLKKLENDNFGNFSNLDELLFYSDGTKRYAYASTKYSIHASQLFFSDRILPYQERSLNKMVNMVFRQLPEHLVNSTEKKIEMMEDIFDEWVKYFYSSFRQIFNVKDIKAERENLLLKNPLGDKLNKIKELTKDKNPNAVKIQNNLLLRNLEVDRTRGLTFVTIPNNQLVHLSAFDLQRAAKELYDNNYPLWEGYTTRDLMVDLFKYAYLVSGKQGPNEFMKYLPLDYIYDNEKIKGIIHANLNEDTLIEDFNDEEIYSFLIQFFQHNPKFAAPQDIKEFNTSATHLTAKDTSKSYPVVFSITSYSQDTGNRNLQLYKRDIQGYVPIPRKGSYLYEMYDNELTIVDGDIDKQAKLKEPRELDVKKVIGNIIKSGAVKSNNPLFKFFEAFDKLDIGYKLVVDPNVGYRGKSNHIDKKIIIKDINDYATLAHELSHAVTRRLTDDFYNNPGKLSPEQKKIISDLIAVYEKMYNDQTPEFKAIVQKIQKELKEREANKSISLKEEERINYAFTSIQEFMSHIVDTKVGFRKWINDNYDNEEGKPNLFAQIRELFKKLLSTFIPSKTTVEFLEERMLSLYETAMTKGDTYFPPISSPYAVDPSRYNEPQEDVSNKELEISKSNNIVEEFSPLDYQYDIVEAITKNMDKVKEWSKKAANSNELINKIRNDLKLSKDQIELLRNSEGNTIEEKLVDFASKYSYVIDVSTTNSFVADKNQDVFSQEPGFILQGKEIPTQHYSNMTVPGGTNYRELEISTPDITPSIKGHAQFATDKGIGWARVDEKVVSGTFRKETKLGNLNIEDVPNEFELGGQKYLKKDGEWYMVTEPFSELTRMKSVGLGEPEVIIAYQSHLDGLDNINNNYTGPNNYSVQSNTYGTPTKTLRVLEVQSDLFQKGRDKEELTSELEAAASVEINGSSLKEFRNNVDRAVKNSRSGNQFLQLLNKDNNWVSFFIKAIIQDAAKAGYEKVLFPSGNTASKVEGHTTLEEFKRIKEDRIKKLENNPSWIDNGEYIIENSYFEHNGKIFDQGSKLIIKDGFYKIVDYDKSEILNREDALKFLKEADITPAFVSDKKEINQLKGELERIDKEGLAALKPIYNFYENQVRKILEKSFNSKSTTDEYGNTWSEVILTESMKNPFLFSKNRVTQEDINKLPDCI